MTIYWKTGFVIVCLLAVTYLSPTFSYRPQSPTPAKEKHIMGQCHIFNLDGTTLWNASRSSFCLHFPDGRALLAGTRGIELVDKTLTRLWHIPKTSHHQVDLIDDHFYVLSDEVVTSDSGLPLRKDVLLKINLNGQIVDTFNYSDFIRPPVGPMEIDETTNKLFREYTHLNSFYKIPKNPSGNVLPAFKAGHFIFNDNRLHMAFVMDAQFEKILWAKKFEEIGVHDVQVLENGKILLYHNRQSIGSSRIETFDPITEKIDVLFEGSKEIPFFSKTNGNVQVLSNGNIFFTICNGEHSRAVEFDPRKKKDNVVLYTKPGTHFNRIDGCYQLVRRVDATDFLKNNRGL